MKKVTSFILSMIFVFSVLAITPSAARAEDNAPIQVVLNGNKVNLSSHAEMINGTVYVPLRSVLEALGAVVSYEQDTQSIAVTTSDTTLVMHVNSSIMNKDNQSVSIAPPVFSESTILVPVRAVVEAFNAKVVWNARTKTVCIFSYIHYLNFSSYQYTLNDQESSYSDVPDFGALSGDGVSVATSTTRDQENIVSYYTYQETSSENSTYFWTYYTNLLTKLGFSESTNVVKGTDYFIYTKGKTTVFIPSLKYSGSTSVPITVVYADPNYWVKA